VFSALYISLRNVALQKDFTLLAPSHWELGQTTEAERVEEAGAVAVCFPLAVLRGDRKKDISPPGKQIHRTKEREGKRQKTRNLPTSSANSV